MTLTLDDHDKQHLRESYDNMQEYWEYDYDGPETIVTSLGYVYLWDDGDVTFNNELIWNVNDD